MPATKKKPGKGGRPALPKANRLSVPLNAWVTPADAATIQQRYEESGLRSKGEYVRQACLNGSVATNTRRADPSVITAICDLANQCRDIGQLYNQDLKYKHLGRTVVDADGHIQRVIADNQARIAAYLDQLVGCDGS